VSLHEPHPADGGTDEDLVQLISPTGERIPGEFDRWVEDVDDEALAGFHADMVVVRRIDTEATALQRQGELALWPPLLGQEAAQVGSARALGAEDFVFPSYRETGVAWCRGIDPLDILRVWRGDAPGGWDPFATNVATQQIVIGAQTLHAAGYAMGLKFDGSDAASVAYFGDGATSQGDVSEALVFAASYQAPVVFFCQNNHWAISEPVHLQTKTRIADRAAGFGMPAFRVDGNDVLAVHAATRASAARVRTGSGPAFIEAVTYRMGPHTTADDPTRYRDAGELDVWRSKDPIARIEAYLASRGAEPEELRSAAERQADAAAARLRRGISEMRDPEPLSVFDHVYAEPHPGLERQREHYSRYLGLFAPDGATAEGAAR
jgi:2-oxoisovalerate dehydrogenase E1 component alpha subunit